MNCPEVIALISPYLDGELTTKQTQAFEAHLAECPTCAHELTVYQHIGNSLRTMGQKSIQTPPDLCGQVMQSLKLEQAKTKTVTPPQPQGIFYRLPAFWRQAVAAAAAILLLAGGSVGVKVALNQPALQSPTVSYVAPTTQSGETANGNGALTEETNLDLAPPEAADPTTVPNQADEDSTGANNQTSANQGAATEKQPAVNSQPDIKDRAVTELAKAVPEPRALLSNNLKVTSTILKVAVNDVNNAKAKAMAQAKSQNAQVQTFPEQVAGKKVMVMRLTTKPAQAPALTNQLYQLGSVLDRQDESRDLTKLYQATYAQYQELQTKLETTTDPAEQQAAVHQMASLKQQLNNLQTEAGQHVIMLWLESNN